MMKQFLELKAKHPMHCAPSSTASAITSGSGSSATSTVSTSVENRPQSRPTLSQSPIFMRSGAKANRTS